MYLSPPASIRVLHVDDNTDLAELVATFLEREDDDFEVETAPSARDGLTRLEEAEFDCVVSDHDMPGKNGLEFLDAVRSMRPELPFILFTGKGSEEVASEAISLGVSDYLQKGSGTEQYELLANRIRTHVEKARTQRELAERESHLRQAQLIANLGSWYKDIDADTIYWSDETFEIFGTDEKTTFDNEQFLEYVHPADRASVDEQWVAGLDGEGYDIEHRIVTDDGETRWVRQRADVRFDDEGRPTDALGIVQDVTEQKQRERKLEVLFDDAPAAIAYTEFEGDRPIVRDVNSAFERTFGVEKAAAIGQSLDDIVVPPQYAEEAASINQRVRAGEQFEIEVRRRTTTGLRTFLLHSVPLRVGESGEQGYAIYNDATAPTNDAE